MSEAKLIPTTDEEQMKLVANRFGSKLSKAELAHFLTIAQATGLDPLRNQVYAIKRGTNMTIQTGIDGFRAIAARSGLHVGTEVDCEYKDDKLIAAKVTVFKHMFGKDRPFIAVARWDEYAVQGGPMWKKMPETMLSKCAEAKALRMAFPEDLSGLYSSEEMAQADRQVSLRQTEELTSRFESMEAPAGVEYVELEEE